MNKYFKKIIAVHKENLGTLTVVSPELVIKKGFNAAVEYADTLMKIPSKVFYSYLGHWLTPDIGLKSGTYTEPYKATEPIKGRGLNIGPFSYDKLSLTYNDLTKANDMRIQSNPGLPDRTLVKEDNSVSDIWSASFDSESPKGGNSDRDKNWRIARWNSATYEWEGEWGSADQTFETEATFLVQLGIQNERVPGSITGHYKPTGAKLLIWCGDGNDWNKDQDTGSYYSYEGNIDDATGGTTAGKNLMKFYNQFWSSGKQEAHNDGKFNRVYPVTIKRPPFSKEIIWNGAFYARGGATYIDLVGMIDVPPIIDALNGIGIGPFSLDIGTKVWNLIMAPIKIIQDLLNLIFGSSERYKGSCSVNLQRVSRITTTMDKTESKGYPAYMNWGGMSEWSYLYNQFEYPTFDRNPCFPSRNVFEYMKPFLENEVIENSYYYNSPNNDFKAGRKYKYFIPNLFRLTFETNPGVFLEKLATQHEDKAPLSKFNFLTKLEHHTTFSDPNTATDPYNAQPYMDQIMFPTNYPVWNDYIENGWSDDSKSSNMGFLQKFVKSATKVDTEISETMPAEYAKVFNDYPKINVHSISEINKIIGDHKKIRDYLRHDKGYELNTWTTLCSSPEFETLSSDDPKNLSYKIIEYMLWYLDRDGIAYKTRNSVKACIDYEIELDRIIEDQKNTPDTGDNLDKYHVIGTQLYDRECL